MAADKRKPYTVAVNGITTTLLLNSEDAARLGERAKPAPARAAGAQAAEDNSTSAVTEAAATKAAAAKTGRSAKGGVKAGK